VSLEHSYSIYIKASPEQVWEALTTPSFTTRYFPGGAVKSDWQEGSDYTMNSADGAKVLYDGRVVVSHRLRRLVQTVNIKFDPSVIGHEEMTIEWDIERFGETCLLTMIHRGGGLRGEPVRDAHQPLPGPDVRHQDPTGDWAAAPDRRACGGRRLRH